MFTAPIPGGTVTLRTASELAVKHRRALQVRLLMFGAARFQQVRTSTARTTEDCAVEIGLTPDEVDALEGFSDAAMWALIESWTLPRPIPESPAAVRALPPDLREALAEVSADESARIWREVLD